MQDATSLKNLRDIVEPDPVSWWPLAPGWWFVISALLVVVVALAVKAARTWQRNAYRRAALKELESASTAAAIDAILKRTALCGYPRATVAALSGQHWHNFLEQTADTKLPAAAAAALNHIFQNQSGDISALMDFARDWIRTHHSANKNTNGHPTPGPLAPTTG